MTEYSDETQEWIAQADLGKKPFAKFFKNGTLIMSTISDDAWTITEHVQNEGLILWRAVDQTRSKRLRITARTLYGRIVLDKSQTERDNSSVNFELQLRRPHPEARVFDEVDYSCQFTVQNTGNEGVESTIGKQNEVVITSRFRADKNFARHTVNDQPKDIDKVDALVITALKDEQDAFLRVCEKHNAKWVDGRDSSNLPYYSTTIQDKEGSDRAG
jgi:hypothetical protein